MDTVWEGDGGTNRESSVNTYTLPYVHSMASGNLLFDLRNSAQCSVAT